MQKILVNFLGKKGGTALYAYEMTKGLIENGAEVYAIISKQNNMLNEWKILKLKKLIIIPTYTNKINFILNSIKFFIKDYFQIKKELISLKIDIIYIPCFNPWFRIINAMLPNAKKIITVHDPLPHSGSFFKNKLVFLLQRQALVKADNIIILTEVFKKHMQFLYNKTSNQIHVIPHGIFSYYKNIEERKKFFYDEKNINFLFFGRIEPYKGLHVLSKAYKKISEEYKNISLTIVGNGDFSEYEYEYKDLKNIRVINRWIEDNEVNIFFRGKNIITVLPYLDATQSGVINIAMMNHSLVIATNTGGIQEQIEDKKTGLLISPNSEIALAKAMIYAIENRSECNKIINQADVLLDRLNWKTLSKKLLNIIDNEIYGGIR